MSANACADKLRSQRRSITDTFAKTDRPFALTKLLVGFVETCLRDQVSLLAIVGHGCSRLEDIVDEIVVGDGSDPARFLCTTSHPDDDLGTVLNMAEHWEMDRDDPIEEVWL